MYLGTPYLVNIIQVRCKIGTEISIRIHVESLRLNCGQRSLSRGSWQVGIGTANQPEGEEKNVMEWTVVASFEGMHKLLKFMLKWLYAYDHLYSEPAICPQCIGLQAKWAAEVMLGKKTIPKRSQRIEDMRKMGQMAGEIKGSY
jgi:hypothetical protein